MNLGEMNTQELNCEVERLLAAKKKNEANVPAELLQTKYRIAYEVLCDSLKNAQSELRSRYASILRGLAEVMADSAYMDPEDKPALLDARLNEENERHGRDPLAESLYIAFYHKHGKEDDHV